MVGYGGRLNFRFVTDTVKSENSSYIGDFDVPPPLSVVVVSADELGAGFMRWVFWWEFYESCNIGAFRVLYLSIALSRVQMHGLQKNSSLKYSMKKRLFSPQFYPPGGSNKKTSCTRTTSPTTTPPTTPRHEHV